MTDVDTKLWKAYFGIINQWAGLGTAGQGGDSTVLFASTGVNRSPIAGNGIPFCYTNEGVWRTADKLLTNDSIFYTAGSDASYFNAVNTWISAAKATDVDPSPEALKALVEAKEAQTEASTQYTATKTAAVKAWENDPDGKSAGTPFTSWAVTNYPQLSTALTMMQSTSAEVTRANTKCYGAGATALNIQQSRLLNANTATSETPGIAMRSDPSYLRGFDSDAYYKALRAGEKPKKIRDPGVPGCTTHPWYALDATYPNNMDRWGSMTSTTPITKTGAFDASSDSQTSWKDYGQSETASKSISIWGIFAWSGPNERDSWSKQNTSSSQDEIHVEVLARDAQIVNINAGNWDVPGFQALYPGLAVSVPGYVKNTVRPTAMLIAAGLTVKVTLSGETKDTFDSTYTKTTQQGGYLKVLGITVGLGSSSSTDTNATHTANWEKSSGVLTLLPTEDAGTAAIMGMIGKKM